MSSLQDLNRIGIVGDQRTYLYRALVDLRRATDTILSPTVPHESLPQSWSSSSTPSGGSQGSSNGGTGSGGTEVYKVTRYRYKRMLMLNDGGTSTTIVGASKSHHTGKENVMDEGTTMTSEGTGKSYHTGKETVNGQELGQP